MYVYTHMYIFTPHIYTYTCICIYMWCEYVCVCFNFSKFGKGCKEEKDK